MSELYRELTDCCICPRNCGVNRYVTVGFCRAGAEIKVNLHQLHFGEEPVLSGTRGSGTIFFSHCNLRCVFCQNHTISDLGWGEFRSQDEIIRMMLELQSKGAHNINLVTPTHYSIQLADILHKAKVNGLTIPVVWNSNAYEKVETLKRLEGLVDVYLPDLKYADDNSSLLYSHASDYSRIARAAIKEMFRQVGQLDCDEYGIARRGLLIRLLVLPEKKAGITESLQWIHDNLGNSVAISLMAQYYPTHQAQNFAEISRGILQEEYEEILNVMEKLGFENGFIQELTCSPEWTPDFKESR
jgi:putative pyruvate formate lyase activating enzyme